MEDKELKKLGKLIGMIGDMAAFDLRDFDMKTEAGQRAAAAKLAQLTGADFDPDILVNARKAVQAAIKKFEADNNLNEEERALFAAALEQAGEKTASLVSCFTAPGPRTPFKALTYERATTIISEAMRLQGLMLEVHAPVEKAVREAEEKEEAAEAQRKAQAAAGPVVQ